MLKTKTSAGFTLVELLIVIVVIAILASISVVAYRGVQERAHDAAVQSDLRNVSSALELHYSDNGAYPGRDNNQEVMDALRDGLVKVKFTTGSYSTVDSVYSTNPAGTIIVGYSTPEQGPCIIAASKSGNKFLYTAIKGVVPVGKNPIDSMGGANDFRSVCRGAGGMSSSIDIVYGRIDLHNY